jgi:two-component system cell cycle sensor histidine kinase/response regulator CckA
MQQHIGTIDHDPRIQQSRRLESLGLLAGGVAHDFNNLMMVVTFSTDFLRKTVAGLVLDDAGRVALTTNIDQIDRAATSAASLTRQLLTFGRSETVSTEPIDINAHVSLLEELLRRSIDENVELVLDLAPALPRVDADSGRLDQLLVNLVVNACDAMVDGGRITLSTSLSVGLTEPGNEQVRIEITDTGAGMALDVTAHAFEPFFTTKGADGGTGLGLATVRSIVTDLGGTVELHSSVGVGTEVVVCLPTAERAARLELVQPTQANIRERILVVADDDDLRSDIAGMVAGAGYRVATAASAALAIEAFDFGEFDLLISDVAMSTITAMSGRELAERLWQDRPELRVIFLSGYYATPVLNSAEQMSRATDVVVKPVDSDQLLRRVRTLLERTPVLR